MLTFVKCFTVLSLNIGSCSNGHEIIISHMLLSLLFISSYKEVHGKKNISKISVFNQQKKNTKEKTELKAAYFFPPIN